MQDKSPDSVRVTYLYRSEEAVAAANRSPILTHFTKTGTPQVGDFVKLDGFEQELRIEKRVWETNPEGTTLFIHIG